jgi:hypothetical protein
MIVSIFPVTLEYSFSGGILVVIIASEEIISGFSREETMSFEDPKKVMLDFNTWIKENCLDHPIFISDNNGFDWMFICWYFCRLP